MTAIEKAERIAHILDDKKGKEIKILHVTDQTVITDYFVITFHECPKLRFAHCGVKSITVGIP